MGVWVTIDDHAVFIENAKGPYSKGKDGKITYTGKDHKGGASKAVAHGPGSSHHDPVKIKMGEKEGKMDEGGAEYKALSDKVLGSINDTERKAVKDWSSAAYGPVREIDQGEMSGISASDKETHKQLYSAFDKLPKYKGTSYRGIRRLPEADVETLRNATEISVEAMSSYSRRPSVAENFAHQPKMSEKGLYGVVFKFQSTAAAHISPASHFAETEAEVLHKKGDKFKVTKTYWAHAGDDDVRPFLVVEGKQI